MDNYFSYTVYIIYLIMLVIVVMDNYVLYIILKYKHIVKAS